VPRSGMKTAGTALAALCLFPFATASADPAPHAAAPQSPAPKKEVFFDDFNGDGLDQSKWQTEVTGENFDTTNGENQAYVNSPDTLYVDHDDASTGAKNGALAIHPRSTPGFQAPDGKSYDFQSARINTKDKFEFTYGSYEARLKLPEGANAKGLWPAWWSLGSNIDEVSWPNCGEVDSMENVGEPWTSSSIHGPEYHGNTPYTNKQNFEGMDPADWHTYKVDWTPDGFTFSIDGKQYLQTTKQQIQQGGGNWVFDNPQFLLLNFALGGQYPNGSNGISEPYYGLSQDAVDKVKAGNVRFLVDYVRVEQN